ncbi:MULTISPECIES: AsmA family protein [unclassified Ruegeria]|uniref:AsmA family protein n=1 Tax=unclassified Ruegeria TaxID=2625375 RepID=UPI00148999CC|nr:MULTISPECIES: AsmA family protein [unclassified Ruegeria]NOD75769.1 AsmA family protein [Ruegeria sp. HKCCD4332]
MKWLMRILFVVVAVVGLVIGALLLMPGDKLGAILAEQVKAQTGRDLTLSGDVRLSFWPVLGMETGPVRFGNASWAGSEPMLSADSLAVGVDAAALWNGDLRIKRVFAENPILRLEQSQGRTNWQFGAPTSTPPAETSGAAVPAETTREVTLDQLELTNAQLIFVENGITQMDFSGVTLAASWPEVTSPMIMQATMAVPGGTVEVDLKIPDLPAFSNGDVTALELSLAAPGGEIGFDGRVNLAGEMDGITRVEARDSEKMFAAFGQAGVHIPPGLGKKANIAAHMTYTQDGRISLRDMTAQLDDNRFLGEADITISDPPQIVARLDAGDLDLSRISESGAAPSGVSQPSTSAVDGWSQDPSDASALALANGKIRLTANSIAVPGMEFGKSDLTLSLDRSRAVLEMHPATLFAGQLNGQVVANNRNGLSVGGKISASGIDLKQALTTMAGVERLSGMAAGSLEFLGVGQSEDQIMRSLSGKGNLDVGSGVISGFDLDRLMGRGTGSGGTTVFNSLTGSFTMDQGVLTNNDLLMSLENFRADGTGTVGLGARDIDYLFTPVALRANSGKGISVPVRIVGPWSNPSIKPDLTKVIEAAADVKVKELEDDAKQKVFEKVGNELDTTITDSDQIEDALKKKLEDEAKKGLLKLFGGN